MNDCLNRGFVVDNLKLGQKDLDVIFFDQKSKNYSPLII